MKLNTRTRYGLRILIYLAKSFKSEKGVLQTEISENEKISFKYMDSIIPVLKKSGLIVNVGGHKSGYKLSRLPSEITVYDLYKSFNKDLNLMHCISNPKSCPLVKSCYSRKYWTKLNDVMVGHMRKMTLRKFITK